MALAGENKTKFTQQGARWLRATWLVSDVTSYPASQSQNRWEIKLPGYWKRVSKCCDESSLWYVWIAVNYCTLTKTCDKAIKMSNFNWYGLHVVKQTMQPDYIIISTINIQYFVLQLITLRTTFKRQPANLFVQWIVVETHRAGCCHRQSSVK